MNNLNEMHFWYQSNTIFEDIEIFQDSFMDLYGSGMICFCLIFLFFIEIIFFINYLHFPLYHIFL